MKTIIILGGGLSGLAAAEKLIDKYKIIILEKENILGGLARSFNYNGVWIPITYHHVLSIDNQTLSYIKRYGLSKYLYWTSINMAFWFGNKGFPLTKPHHIFAFSPLSLVSKINLIKLGLFVRLKKNFDKLKGISAEKWLTDFVGKEAVEKLFRRLAEIKFGDLALVDAAWYASSLAEAATAQEKYAYLTCGYQKLIGLMADTIREKKGAILTNVLVKKISKEKVYAIVNGKSKLFKADKIISSIPPKVLAKIASLPKDKYQQLNCINYQSIICMVLISKEKSLKNYWNVFIYPKLSFGGIFNHSALYPHQVIKGENLYYIFKYLNEKDPFYNLSEKKIKTAFLHDLKILFPSFEYSWAKVFKIKESSSVYAKDYQNPPIKLINNLYLTGVYKEYPATRTMHTALQSGIKTAAYILNETKDAPQIQK